MAKAVRMNPRVCEKLATRNAAPAKQREVAALAYKLWFARGFQNGSPQEDWLRAQRGVGRQRLRASGGRVSHANSTL
jgi:hypothetical protein